MSQATIKFHLNPNDHRECPEGFYLSGRGVYLHGDIEDHCHYDIGYANTQFEGLQDGIYPVIFNGVENATLYFKHQEIDKGFFRIRGLVIWNNDSTLEAVKEDFNSNSHFFKI